MSQDLGTTKSEALHLTTVDFDISRIHGTLETMQAELRAAVKKIETDDAYKIKLRIDGISQTDITKTISNALMPSQTFDSAELQTIVGSMNSVSNSAIDMGEDIQKSGKMASGSYEDYINQLKTAVSTMGTMRNFSWKEIYEVPADAVAGNNEIVTGLRAIVEYADQNNVIQKEVYQAIVKNGQATGEWNKASLAGNDNIQKRTKAYEDESKTLKQISAELSNQLHYLNQSNVGQGYKDFYDDILSDQRQVFDLQQKIDQQGYLTADQRSQSEYLKSSVALTSQLLKETTSVKTAYNAQNSELAELIVGYQKYVSLIQTGAVKDLSGDMYRDAQEQLVELINLQTRLNREQGATESAQPSIDASQKILASLDARYKKEQQYIAQQENNEAKALAQRTKMYADMFDYIEKEAAKVTAAQQKEYDKQLAALKQLARDQEKAISATNMLPSTSQNRKAILEMESNLTGINGLLRNISTQDAISPSQIEQVKSYSNQYKDLKTQVNTANGSIQHMLQTISDKARWLAAFYVVSIVKDAFIDMAKTIKDTEMSVIELQRVLEEDISAESIQGELFSIAKEYGRSIEEVMDTSVRFAQTGEDWNEVLALTESTMLAVNTAELQVETATTGLIAVISQFNIEAKDMIDVIDNINITADNFNVTSEKIVAALQRTGSAAVNANLSLEDTIAVITAMSKATGRSGETIGTALNSLLVYSQRAESLEIFAGLSDGMAQAVREFETGQRSIVDVWGELSKTLATMSEEAVIALDQALQSDAAYEQFASTLENEAIDITTAIQETYATAGTHRQNYFIALLDSMDTYSDALKGMTDAEGYSLKENEQYMSSLTAQYETLISNLKELAVEFGNVEGLEFLKWLVDTGNEAIELTRNMGGISEVLKIISMLIIALNAHKISGWVTGIKDGAKELITFGKAATASVFSMGKLEGGIKQADASTKSLSKSLPSLTTAIGAAATAAAAFIAITSAMAAANRKAEEEIQQRIEAEYENAIASAESANRAKELVSELSALNEQRQKGEVGVEDASKQLLDIQQSLTDELGQQVKEIDFLNSGYKDLEDAVDGVYQKQREITRELLKGVALSSESATLYSQTEMERDVRSASAMWSSFARGAYSTIGLEVEDLRTVVDDFNQVLTEQQKASLSAFPGTDILDYIAGQDIEAQYETFVGLLERMNELEAQEPGVQFAEGIAFASEAITKYNEVMGRATQATYELNQMHAEDVLKNAFDIDTVDTQDEFDALIDTLNDVKDTLGFIPMESANAADEIAYLASEITKVWGEDYGALFESLDVGEITGVDQLSEFIDILIQAVSEQTGFSSAMEVTSNETDNLVARYEDAKLAVEQLSESTSEYEQSLSDHEASIHAIQQAAEEYDATGRLSASTIRSLAGLSKEYQSALNLTGEGVTLLDGKVEELVYKEEALLIAMLQESAAAQIAELAHRLLSEEVGDVSASADDASASMSALTSNISNAIGVATEAGTKFLALDAVLGKLSGDELGLDASAYDEFAAGVEDIVGNYNAIVGQIGGMSNSFDGYTGSASGASSATEEFVSAYEALIDLENARMGRSEAEGLGTDKQIIHLTELIHLTKMLKADYESVDPEKFAKEIIQAETDIANFQNEINEVLIGVQEDNISYQEQRLDFAQETEQGLHAELDAVKELQKANEELIKTYQELGYAESSTEIMSARQEQYQLAKEELAIRVDSVQAQIDAEQELLTFAEKTNAPIEEQIEHLRTVQDLLHEQANIYRAIGEGDSSERQALSSEWWDVEEDIYNRMNNYLSEQIAQQEEIMSFEEATNKPLTEQIDNRERIQDLLHQQANLLRDLGYEEDSAEIKALQVAWWEQEAAIQQSIIGENEKLITSEEKRLALAEESNASTLTQISYIKNLQNLIAQTISDLNALDPAKYQDEILDYTAEWYSLNNQIIDLLTEQEQERRDALTESYELEIDKLEQQQELIEERYNKEIELIQAAQDERDRQRAWDDYQQSLSDAERDKASAEARTGTEYREQEWEAEQSILDIQKDWQKQLEQWAVEDTIAKLEMMRDAEIAVVESQIEKIKLTIEQLSEEIVVSIGNVNNALLDDMYANSQQKLINVSKESADLLGISFAQPVAQQTAEALAASGVQIVEGAKVSSAELLGVYDTNFITPMQAGTVTIFDNMLLLAQENAKTMYEIYSTEFLSRLQADIESIKNSGFGSQMQYSSSRQTSGAYNNVNTDNRSANINVTMGGSSNMSSIYHTLDELLGKK